MCLAISGKRYIEVVLEYDAEKNIWNLERRRNRSANKAFLITSSFSSIPSKVVYADFISAVCDTCPAHFIALTLTRAQNHAYSFRERERHSTLTHSETKFIFRE